jgi:hypothetical protein
MGRLLLLTMLIWPRLWLLLSPEVLDGLRASLA